MKRIKNRYPTNIVRNPYDENPKRSTIVTPLWLCEYIFKIVHPILKKNLIKEIIDIGCHKGNLSLPFKNNNYRCIGVDNHKVNYHSKFIKLNFLEAEDYGISKHIKKIIICNPPFNDEKREYGKQLIPELFLRNILRMFGNKIPLIFFSPMGLLKNQSLSSNRWKWIRDCGAKITSELELPIDTYIPLGNREKYERDLKFIRNDFKLGKKNGLKKWKAELYEVDQMLKRKYKIILVHSSVLFFNIKGLPAKIFLDV